MNKFYDSLRMEDKASPSDVARGYGRTVNRYYRRLLRAKTISTSPYYVGLSSDLGSFTHVTKRVTLVTDTMLLSDHGVGTAHEVGIATATGSSNIDVAWRLGMVTADLVELGQWLLDAEPLLRRAGLVWARVRARGVRGVRPGPQWSDALPALPSLTDRSIDFLVEHGRAVDLSRTKPLASRVVRPVLEIDLPFIDGLSLIDFAQVTSDEFDSYRQYRDFMRSRLLDLDDALEAVDSEVALERVALSIRDELNAATAELRSAARSRALSRSGAVLGTDERSPCLGPARGPPRCPCRQCDDRSRGHRPVADHPGVRRRQIQTHARQVALRMGPAEEGRTLRLPVGPAI
ncbi:hypothetical protein AB0D11_18150 [Streptomyces monashensis]|uniref:hypothetical protein n=1 Tax=Streptomyces monashensis TaxID=1678012 RepID=UPI0033F937B5